MTVRTRFAPSPTGYMHIGGMRTALFNWLWARHTGGTFILRIDDTDQQRNVDEALAPILDAFCWLGINWDEGPLPYSAAREQWLAARSGASRPRVIGVNDYFQSRRGQLYDRAIQQLLAAGNAYRDFDPPELAKADREAAEREKRPYVSLRRSLELSPAQVEQHLGEGRPHVVRLLVPRDRTIAIDDVVRGHVEWDCNLLADPVLVRGDGSPLYNFATVVDDIEMRITHVIRAEEHLSNTPIQALVFEALGQPLPIFAHIPYVAAPGTKEKISKRKLHVYRQSPAFKAMFDAADRVFPRIGLGSSETLNPVMVEYYERIGYLPAAVLNALARLGWSLDDRTEIMSLDRVVENFTLERVIKSPAGFDPDKLDSFQLHWMGQLSVEERVGGCRPFLERAGLVGTAAAGGSTGEDGGWRTDDGGRAYVAQVVTVLGERLKTFGDILSFEEFFLADEDLPYEEKAFDKRIRKPAQAIPLLKAFRERLTAVQPFDAPTLEKLMHDVAESAGAKLGDIIHAVRIAVTGKPAGPGMFETLELLGRERCVARIDRALDRV